MNSSIYPVITLYQPWATWIMRRWKGIETRTHNRFECLKNKTVLIHAGKTTDAGALHNRFLSKEQILHDPDEMVNGFILGSVFVFDTGRLNASHSPAALIDCESVERYGLFMDQVKKFDHPIPELGEMGIWYYDLEKRMKVKKPISSTPTLF